MVREGEARGERRAIVTESRVAVPRALLQLLPQAAGLDQYIVRISKLLLPLVAKPAKVRPVSLSSLSANRTGINTASKQQLRPKAVSVYTGEYG